MLWSGTLREEVLVFIRLNQKYELLIGSTHMCSLLLQQQLELELKTAWGDMLHVSCAFGKAPF